MRNLLDLLFTLILINVSSAQYANELVYNGTFDTDISGWVNGSGATGYDTFQWLNGEANAIYSSGTGWKLFGISDGKRFNIASGLTYRYKFSSTVNSGDTQILTAWRSTAGGSQLKSWSGIGAGDHVLNWTSDATGAVSISYDNNAIIDFSIDNASVRQKLDTLWTDGSQGDDADNDTTKTLSEAFEVRGAHSGGYFIVVPGTYNENITIDSSFSKWESSGGAVYIDRVDFNNRTLNIDYNIWANIRSSRNYKNVTVFNVPANKLHVVKRGWSLW